MKKCLFIGFTLVLILFAGFTVCSFSLFDDLNVVKGTTTVGTLNLPMKGIRYELEQGTLSEEVFQRLFFNRFNLIVVCKVDCIVIPYGVKVFVNDLDAKVIKEEIYDDLNEKVIKEKIFLKKGSYKISIIYLPEESVEMLCLIFET